MDKSKQHPTAPASSVARRNQREDVDRAEAAPPKNEGEGAQSRLTALSGHSALSNQTDDSWLREVLTRAKRQSDDSAEEGSAFSMPEPPSGGPDESPARVSGASKNQAEPQSADQSTNKNGMVSPSGNYEEKRNLCKMASAYTTKTPDSGKESTKEQFDGDEATSDLRDDVTVAVGRLPNPPPGDIKAAESGLRKVIRQEESNSRHVGSNDTQGTIAELPPTRPRREAVPGAFLADSNGTVPAEPVRYSVLSASTATNPSGQYGSEHDVEAPLPCSSSLEPRESNGNETSVQLPDPDDNSQRGSSRFLAVADPISSHFMALAEAVGRGDQRRSHSEREEESKQSKMKFVGIVAVLVLVGLTALMVVVLTGASDQEGGDQTPTTNPTQAPQLPMEEHVRSLLPEYTLAAMKSPTSVQSIAYQWLLDDPNVTTYPSWRIQQRLALAIFYHTTKGDQWKKSTNWLSYDHHECEWYTAQSIPWEIARQELDPNDLNLEEVWDAPVCDTPESPGAYTRLRLYSNNIQGSIPREIVLLSSLRTLFVFINDVRGTIPSEIADLKSLEYLGFATNDLSGTIPTEVGLMSSLKGVGLSVNPSLNGTLPTEMGVLGNLNSLNVEDCALTGTVPTEFGLLTNLRTLVLSHNHLVGSLPTELGLLTRLAYFRAYANGLTGRIPSEIGLMRFVLDLELDENMLTGTIPLGLWSLTDLSYLDFHGNELEGSLPTEIGLPTKLYGLSIGGNKLEGPIPLQLYNLTDMWWLYLDESSFSGSIHSLVGQLTELRELYFSNTAMTGEVPTEIGLLTSLEHFVASNSSLSKAIPLELGDLVNLTVLDLSHNPLLSGSIPDELCNIPVVFTCSETLCGCSCSCE